LEKYKIIFKANKHGSKSLTHMSLTEGEKKALSLFLLLLLLVLLLISQKMGQKKILNIKIHLVITAW
jgi:hypothetical protein